MEYLMLVLSAVLIALDFSLNKVYQKLKGTSLKTSLAFNSLLGLFTAIIFFAINGFKMDFTYYSFIMAALGNGLAMCYNILGFKLLKSGTMAMYTLFLMSGGMIIPYIFGLIFLKETFFVIEMVAIIVILAGVIMSNANKEKINSKQIALLIAVFILNGFVSVVSKIHQVEVRFDTVTATEFVFLGGIFKFIFAGISCLLTKNQTEIKKEKKSFIPVVITVGSALASGFSYLLLLFGAVSLPATVLYPFVTGGTIALSSLAGVIFFNDKLSKSVIAGVVLCIIGTIMFL